MSLEYSNTKRELGNEVVVSWFWSGLLFYSPDLGCWYCVFNAEETLQIEDGLLYSMLQTT
jgi:hypothetical protein